MAQDVNEFERLYARAALRWRINDDWDTTLTYHYQDDDSGGRQVNHQDSIALIANDQGVDIPNGFYENAHRVREPNERTNQILEWVVTGDLGFAELTTALGYTHYEEDGQRDQTDLLLTFGYTYADYPQFTAFTAESADQDNVSFEARLVSPGDSRLNWIGGFFYQDFKSDAPSIEFTPCLYGVYPGDPTNLNSLCPSGPGGASGVIEIPEVRRRYGRNVEYIQEVVEETEEWAVFGEISYYLTDAWQVTLGGRYFDVEDEFRQQVGFPLLNQIFGLPATIDPTDPDQIALLCANVGSSGNCMPTTQSFDDFIFKVNTSYDFSEDLMAYFTFSQGYRNGGSNSILDCADLPNNANVVCGTPDQLAFDTDETDNWEIGIRSQWLDNTVTANAALYFIQWDNVQLTDLSASGGLPITTNGDEAESKGVELELSWALTDYVTLRGAYSYTDAQLTKDAPLLAEGTARDGDRLPGTPEHQGSLFVEGLWPMANGLEVGGSLGFTSQSDVFTKLGVGSSCCRPDDGVTAFSQPGPGEKLPGFTIWYASLDLVGDRWSASLYADNLFDKQAVTGVRADESYIARAGGASNYAFRRYFNYVLTPRVVGLDLRYRFD